VRGLGASSAPSITDEKGSHATLNADAHSSAPPKISLPPWRSSSPLPAALLLRVALAGCVEEESVRLVRRCCARSRERGRSVQRASFKDASSSSSAGSSSCCRVSPARARESVEAGGGFEGEYSSCVCACVRVCVCVCARACVHKGNHHEDDAQERQLTQHRSSPLPAHPRTLAPAPTPAAHARQPRSLPNSLTSVSRAAFRVHCVCMVRASGFMVCVWFV